MFCSIFRKLAGKFYEFTRHAVGINDVLIEILYEGYTIAIYICLKGEVLFILGLPITSKIPTLIAMVGQHGSKKLFYSLIGGIKETQEILNYSIENNIYPTVEITKTDAKTISKAYRKVMDGKLSLDM